MKTCSKCERKLKNDMFGKHSSSKDGLRSICKECRKLEYQENKGEILKRRKQYYEDNKEEILMKQSEYQKNNPEVHRKANKNYSIKNEWKIRSYKAKFYQENKEEIKSKHHDYRLANKEKISEYNKRYRQENRELLRKIWETYSENNKGKIKKYKAKYRQQNLHLCKERKANYRARLLNNTVERISYKKILERDGMYCYICNKKINDNNYHFDHVIPLIKGGAHSMENIKVTHAHCNLVKNHRTVDEARELLEVKPSDE